MCRGGRIIYGEGFSNKCGRLIKSEYFFFFFFQAEDGIRDAQESRGLGDVYKRQLSINPGKLSGQCGKLKCCLNYELGTYLEALKYIPRKEIKIKTKKGIAVCQKVDIFKRRLWYSYLNHPIDWH